MKKFLFVAIIALLTTTSGAFAQTPVATKTFTAVTIKNAGDSTRIADTLKNWDANTIGHRVSYKYDLLFKVKYTKVSGYMRVTSKLKGCWDSTGTQCFTIRGIKTQCALCSDSTFTTSNIANDYATWFVPRSPFPYYRLYNISDTGQSTVVTLTTDFGY